MGQYTEFLEEIKDKISPEDNDYKEKLVEMANSFRTFDVALDEFIAQRGFDGDLADVDAKIKYIKQRFEAEQIVLDIRNLKKWYKEHIMSKDRNIAFQFCFAFKLNLAETQDFFRKVYLQRGIDCHDVKEAVYYYAIINGLSYTEAQEIIQQVPKADAKKLNFNDKVLFTGTIIKELDRFKSKEELLDFLKSNIEQFGYNNATAYKYINEIWDMVASAEGLANKEQELLYSEEHHSEKKRSVWEIYLQIFGLRDYDEENNTPLFVVKNRTLKPILKSNPLLHPLAEEAFPDRQGLEGILRGEHQSFEVVRKTIILLTFYRYWVKLILKHKNLFYAPAPDECNRCYSTINQYLVNAGYPELYHGNPYDWIFMFASQDIYPLDTFRFFMRELYIYKEESNRLEETDLQS